MNSDHGHPHNEYSDADTPEDVRPLIRSQGEKEPELETGQASEGKHETREERHPFLQLVYWLKRKRASMTRWVVVKARKVGLHDWLMVSFTGLLTIATIAQVVVAIENSISSTKQLNEMIRAADRIEDAADSFSGSAAHIDAGISDAVKQLKDQAGSTRKAAGIADQTLHVSQRAYLTITTPTIDTSRKSFDIAITNEGHMPSGPVHAVFNEAMISVVNLLSNSFDLKNVSEKHWSERRPVEIFQQTRYDIDMMLPEMDADTYKSGRQVVFVTGFITFSDGFPNSPIQTRTFCWRTIYHTVVKAPVVQDCDYSQYNPQIEKLTGYPNTPPQ